MAEMRMALTVSPASSRKSRFVSGLQQNNALPVLHIVLGQRLVWFAEGYYLRRFRSNAFPGP